jgi:hypothetical protein
MLWPENIRVHLHKMSLYSWSNYAPKAQKYSKGKNWGNMYIIVLAAGDSFEVAFILAWKRVTEVRCFKYSIRIIEKNLASCSRVCSSFNCLTSSLQHYIKYGCLNARQYFVWRIKWWFPAALHIALVRSWTSLLAPNAALPGGNWKIGQILWICAIGVF